MQNPDVIAASEPRSLDTLDAGGVSPLADGPDVADPPGSVESYAEILGAYFTSRAEEALYRASLLSQKFIEEGLGPEEIIAIHAEAVELATQGLGYRERARASTDALQFLLEMMIAYGVQYRAYLDLRLREREHAGRGSGPSRGPSAGVAARLRSGRRRDGGAGGLRAGNEPAPVRGRG